MQDYTDLLLRLQVLLVVTLKIVLRSVTCSERLKTFEAEAAAARLQLLCFLLLLTSTYIKKEAQCFGDYAQNTL